jgi:hypothetical protein
MVVGRPSGRQRAGSPALIEGRWRVSGRRGAGMARHRNETDLAPRPDPKHRGALGCRAEARPTGLLDAPAGDQGHPRGLQRTAPKAASEAHGPAAGSLPRATDASTCQASPAAPRRPAATRPAPATRMVAGRPSGRQPPPRAASPDSPSPVGWAERSEAQHVDVARRTAVAAVPRAADHARAARRAARSLSAATRSRCRFGCGCRGKSAGFRHSH